MVLVFYLLCIVSMMTIRPCLNRVFLKKGKTAIYNSLYFVPVLSLFHTVAGGLICEWYQWPHSASKLITFLFYNFADYSFPYLSVIISMISNAAHFSLKLDQSMKSLILSSVKEMKNTVVISMYYEAMLYYGTRSFKLCQHCILEAQFAMQCLKSVILRINSITGLVDTRKTCCFLWDRSHRTSNFVGLPKHPSNLVYHICYSYHIESRVFAALATFRLSRSFVNGP